MQFFECPFSLHARKNPKLPALIDNKKEWTYIECNRMIHSITKNLKDLGIKEGDVVAFFPTYTIPTPLLFFALYRLEAIACPLNTYLSIGLVAKQLDQLQAAFFLYPDSLDVSSINTPTLPFSKLFIKRTYQNGTYFYQKEALGTYLFTSGTSSAPKIACLSMGNFYYSALGSNPYCLLETRDRWYLSLPLYHVAGISILFRCFLKGAAVILSEKKLSCEELIKNQTTHLSYVPTQLATLLKSSSKHLKLFCTQLKCLLIGGAPCSPFLYREGLECGLNLYLTYGMTEMSSQICMQKKSSRHFFSQGSLLPYRELKLASGGEVLVRGKTLFKGFLGKTKQIKHISPLAGGWYHTKDIATFSEKTGLTIIGRKDKLFISGGENIYPEEIEQALLHFPDVLEARVEAFPDKTFGFRPHAFIRVKKAFKEEALKEFLTSLLPAFKIPDQFHLTKKAETNNFKTTCKGL